MDQNYPKIGAGAIIINDGKILLAKRKGSHNSGKWGSFGGHVKFGETPIEAAKREAKEELGIEIDNFTFATCMNLIIEDRHFLDISFIAELISGEPKIQEPHRIEEIRWFPLDDLPIPLFEPVRVVLESLKTGKNYFEIKDVDE